MFSLGQHPALEAVTRQLRAGELLFAFLDDVYVVCSPARVGVIHTLLENALWGHAGKTKVWNRAGIRPEACDFLERRAQLVVERARVWRGGDEAGTAEQGHPLQHVREHHQTLLDRIPLVPDVQSCWALLLHCAAARANYFIRVVPPELSEEFATSHDNALWMCLSRVLDMPPDACARSAKDAASLPLAFGGMGLRSAV